MKNGARYNDTSLSFIWPGIIANFKPKKQGKDHAEVPKSKQSHALWIHARVCFLSACLERNGKAASYLYGAVVKNACVQLHVIHL